MSNEQQAISAERYTEMERICKLSLQCYGYNIEKVRVPDRSKKIAHARIITMLVLALEGYGVSQIGKYFVRDGSTAHKNIKKAKDLMTVDTTYKAEVQELRQLLK